MDTLNDADSLNKNLIKRIDISMNSTVNLYFNERPTLFYNFFHASMSVFFRKNKKTFSESQTPLISTRLNNFCIDPKHLSEFNRTCDISDTKELSLIYPLTLIFPFFQRMLTLKQAPLSVFNVLGKRLQIVQHRKIGVDEKLDIQCKITGSKIIPKGLELYLSGIIQIAGKIAWEVTETFFYPGNFDKADPTYEPPQFELIDDTKNTTKWFLPEGLGFRFAKISGDANGIHYLKIYARMLGFERDFAQPFLVLGTSINLISNINMAEAVSLDVAFKGQFYYKRNVIIKSISKKDAHRFDIYSEENDLPCMNGLLRQE
jgi:hypothetical protein